MSWKDLGGVVCFLSWSIPPLRFTLILTRLWLISLMNVPGCRQPAGDSQHFLSSFLAQLLHPRKVPSAAISLCLLLCLPDGLFLCLVSPLSLYSRTLAESQMCPWGWWAKPQLALLSVLLCFESAESSALEIIFAHLLMRCLILRCRAGHLFASPL